MTERFILNNKKGIQFILFLNLFFVLISIAVYFRGGQYGWLKFNAIFVILSLFLFIKKGEISKDGISVYYPFRFFRRRVNISAMSIKRITVSYHDTGKNYPNIAIFFKKPPFYIEFRLGGDELINKKYLLTVLNKLKEDNPSIIKVIPIKHSS